MATARAGAGTLAYEEFGAGDETLVFHWGMFGDRELFRPLAERLAGLGRCVLVDGRGYGASQPATAPYTLEDYADDVADFLDEVVGAPAVLVGQSMGAMTFLRLALVRPDLVRGLVLIDTSAQGEDPDKKPMYEAMLANAADNGITPELLDLVGMLLISERFRAAAPDAVAAWREALLALRDRFEAFRLHARAVLDRGDLTDRLGGIRAPALVLVGAEDAATVPQRSEALAEGLGGPVEFVSIPEAGHFAAWEQPEATAAAVRTWMGTLP